MSILKVTNLLVSLSVLGTVGCVSETVVNDNIETPTRIATGSVLDHDDLARVKKAIQTGDSLYLIPFELLKEQAEALLELEPPSVMNKLMTPSSGDKHDYASLGPYWWPNPDTEDGLPYIRKDGVVNPERNKFDKVPGATMADAVETFTLMYYFTENEIYAEKASEFLKVWFLNPETRMNPNLNFGQFIPGRSEGRSVGIIESRRFVFLTDYEPLLMSSVHWTDENHQKFKTWMTDFLNWLVTSDLGQQEQARKNNHGSWCDYQLLALSQYCDVPEVGMKIAGSVELNRLEKQFDEVGAQPEELARTKSYSYSVFNLSALVKIAILAENYGIDLSENEESALKRGIDYLLPYTLGEMEWEYTQISSMDGSKQKMISLLTYTLSKWTDDQYAETLQYLITKFPDTRLILTTPAIIELKLGQKFEGKQ